MKKRILVPLVVLLAFVLLAGCAGQGAGGQAGTAAVTADESLTADLSWWHFPWGLTFGHATVEDWAAYQIAKFQETYPNVNIEFSELPWDNWQAAVSAGIAAGTAPDTFAFGSWLALNYFEHLWPVTEYIQPELDDFIEAAVGVGEFNNEIWAWPWRMSAVTLAVNMNIANEVGAYIPDNETGDWTLDQFMNAVELMTFSRTGGGTPDVFGYVIYAIDPSINWGMMSWLGNFGGRMFTEDSMWATLNSSENIQALEFLLDLDYRGLVPMGASALTIGDTVEMFLSGQVAMIIGGDLVSQIELAYQEGRIDEIFEIRNMQFPTVPGRDTTTTRTEATGFVVFRQRDNADARRVATMEFARQLTSAESVRHSVEAQIIMPTRRSLSYLVENQVLATATERGIIFFDALIEEPLYAEEFTATLQSVFNRSVTPAEAVANFDEIINERARREFEVRGIDH